MPKMKKYTGKVRAWQRFESQTQQQQQQKETGQKISDSVRFLKSII